MFESEAFAAIDGVRQCMGPHDTTLVHAEVLNQFINVVETVGMQNLWISPSINATLTIAEKAADSDSQVCGKD